jgi:hypothetical protein
MATLQMENMQLNIRYAESPNTTVNLMCSLTGVDYVNTVNGGADDKC